MKFLSICSGIEAASVAWNPIGFEAIGFSEIEPFCCELLRQKYPSTPNFGDMTNHGRWQKFDRPEIIVGGTPCQSFSIAGLRKGLADPRGNLMLTYLEIVKCNQPRWVVWENVPGVLSSNGGRDFGTFIGCLAEFGYHVSWRVLDASGFGVPQRRKRVFVVGYLGERTDSGKILFKPEGNDGNKQKDKQRAISPTLQTTCNDYSRADGFLIIESGKRYRRLTPIECERLQGFPDGYTAIPWRNKSASDCPDGPRYKALGNSMAVPVVRWIGERIKMHDQGLL